MLKRSILLFFILFVIIKTTKLPAEVYLEGYGGLAGGCSTISNINVFTKNSYGLLGLNGEFDNHFTSKQVSPISVMGFRIGTWSNENEIYNWNLPDWMESIGFYVDLSFNRHDHHPSKGSTKVTYVTRTVNGSSVIIQGPATAKANMFFSAKGFDTTLAFMVAYRWGFLHDDQIPFGRIQPYLALGPAVLSATQKVNMQVGPHSAVADDLNITTHNKRSIMHRKRSQASAALAIDAGVRYLFVNNLSLDFFVRYRLARPHVSHQNHRFEATTEREAFFSIKTNYHLFSAQLGLAYHF